jgi:hypothetical protein
MRSGIRRCPMYRAFLGSIVGLSRTHHARGTDLNNWKLNPMPIVTLRGWAFRESEHQQSSRTARLIRLVATTIRGLFAARRRTTSREALPNGDRRHLHSG